LKHACENLSKSGFVLPNVLFIERSEGDVPYSFTVSPLGVESESHPRWFENPGIQAVILFTLFLLTISVGSSALLVRLTLVCCR